MSEHRAEKHTPNPWRVPVAIEDVPGDGQHFVLKADADARAAIARMAGLRDLPRLDADFEVTRLGTGLRVAGQVSATVGQTCVVTLEPLTNEIAETMDLLFMPKAELPASVETDTGENPEPIKWDEPEPLVGGVVDLGALATEFLLLGLDPYPRKADAVFEPPRDLKPDDSPFAALAGWSKAHGRH
jgi:hypothetical protein